MRRVPLHVAGSLHNQIGCCGSLLATMSVASSLIGASPDSEIFSSQRSSPLDVIVSACRCRRVTVVIHQHIAVFRDLLLPEIFSVGRHCFSMLLLACHRCHSSVFFSCRDQGSFPSLRPGPINPQPCCGPRSIGLMCCTSLAHLTSHLFGAFNVPPLWCLFCSLVGCQTGSDEPNKHCHCWPVFVTAMIRSDHIQFHSQKQSAA